MTFSSIGDLASTLMLSRSSAQARQSLARLSTELTTGVTADTRAVVRGDFSTLSDWEQSIQSAQAREKTLGEAFGRVQAKQTVLDGVGNAIGTLANTISLGTASRQKPAMDAVAASAKDVLGQTVAGVNVTIGGNTLFGGAATHLPALANADAIFTSAKAAVVGATTVSDVVHRLQTWMDDPVNGYSAQAYLGSTDDGPPVRLSASHATQPPGRGDDEAIRSTVQGLLLAAFSGEADLMVQPVAQQQLLDQASNKLRSAEGQLITLQASVGLAEGQIAQAKTKASSEISTAQQLRLSALGVDQFETASRLQNTELQLEKIYMLTARSARMSLAEYLR